MATPALSRARFRHRLLLALERSQDVGQGECDQAAVIPSRVLFPV